MKELQKLIDLLKVKAKKAETDADLYEKIDLNSYWFHQGKSVAFFAAINEVEELLKT